MSVSNVYIVSKLAVIEAIYFLLNLTSKYRMISIFIPSNSEKTIVSVAISLEIILNLMIFWIIFKHEKKKKKQFYNTCSLITED